MEIVIEAIVEEIKKLKGKAQFALVEDGATVEGQSQQ